MRPYGRRMRSRSTSLAAVLVVVAVLVAGFAFATAHPAGAVEAWTRPVPGRVVRGFTTPRTRYGRAHSGVDFAAPPGSDVRAAGAGVVVFAGVVAGTRHVVVRHAGGWRTSYSFLASIRVHRAETLRRGAVLGTTGGTGEEHGPGVLHLGLRIGETYVDPMQLFSPVDLAARVHLAPVVDGDARGAPTFVADEVQALMTGVVARPAPVVLSASAVRGEAVPICDHRARFRVESAPEPAIRPG